MNIKPMKLPSKRTFQLNGKWVEPKSQTVVLVCPKCANKYIKSREGQTVCVKCLFGRVAGDKVRR